MIKSLSIVGGPIYNMQQSAGQLYSQNTSACARISTIDSESRGKHRGGF